jgi:hypothetical protein
MEKRDRKKAKGEEAPNQKALREPPAEKTVKLPLPQEFIKTEKNLETLGFFSPSSKRSRKSTKKVISFTKVVDGNKVEAATTIFPSAEFGLPNTADLDKYRAFQKILGDEVAKEGKVPKQITLTSADLIRIMGRSKEGKLYKEIEDWLMRMTLTGIRSEGAVWLARKKVWAKDLFHIFERVIVYGQEMDDGIIADRHHVWLSDWQMENINAFYLLTLDYDLHKQLTRPIAKSLLSMLQIGFYASGHVYTKRYNDLCRFFGIAKYKALSRIKEQLDPSNDELKNWGFISEYEYSKTADDRTYNITWQAGERFHTAQKMMEEKKRKAISGSQQLELPAPKKQKKLELLPLPLDDEGKELAKELEGRGLTRSAARSLASEYDGRRIREKIGVLDYLTAKDDSKVSRNPAGWLRRAIEEDYQAPKEYVDQRDKEARERKEKDRRERWLQHREELIEYDVADWDKTPPEERAKGPLGFWIAVEKSGGPQPTPEQIEAKKQELIDNLPKTDEEKREYIALNYPEEPAEDFE